ncbi:MAG: serine/threonine-protein kinase [Thermosynechococcaceae cyanobacterium]
MTSLASCSRGHPNPSSHRFCQQCGEPLQSSMHIGKVIGDRYRVIEELGRGGFGQTYLVEDSNRFNERCVIKVFAPEVEGPKALSKAKELFNREAGVLYRLEHPQIPKFREWFMEEPSLYLVQDYVAGPTYQALLKQRKQQGDLFSEAEVTHFLKQMLPVLDYIHDRGMIHRDISPDNLIQRQGDRKPVLIDFGGVKEITASFGHFGSGPHNGVTLIGKPGYAPEEQIRLGRASTASDIYALGVTALVLLVGERPHNFFDPNSSTFKWQKFVQLSPGFAAVIEQMVASHAIKRYRTATQVLQALKHLEIAAIVDAPSEAFTVPVAPPPPAPLPSVPFSPAPDPSGTYGAEAHPVTQQTVIAQVYDNSPEPVEKAKGGCGHGLVKLLQGLLVIAAMMTAGAFAFSAVYTRLLQPSTGSTPTVSPEPQSLSQDEKDRKDDLFKRLRSLNVGVTYFSQVTNEAFYLKYPNYERRPLTTGAEDAQLRAQWDQVGTQVVDALEAVEATPRRRIGRYGASTRQTFDAQLRQGRINSRQFYRDVDRQFERQLPMYRGVEVANQKGEQIWFAIASDRLQQELSSN